jgi:hypothetical protein
MRATAVHRDVGRHWLGNVRALLAADAASVAPVAGGRGAPRAEGSLTNHLAPALEPKARFLGVELIVMRR